MNYIKKISIKLICLLTLAWCSHAAAQPVTDAFYSSREMSRLQLALQDTTHLSFQAMFCISFNNATSDTIMYDYKISKNKLWLWASDSTEVVQNNFYNLVLYHTRKRAIVSRPEQVAKFLLHANVLDASFYKLFVNNRSVSDSGGYRKLSYNFKNGSPYQQYDIVYDSTTYRMHSIKYRFDPDPLNNSVSNSKSPWCVHIIFSNYQTGGFTDAVFNTDVWFVRKNGMYALVPPFTNYTLTNSLNQ